METIQQNSIQAWLIVLLAALFFFTEFIRVNLFNAVASDLMQYFHINAAQLGGLSAMYLFANVILVFPAGIILDRFPTRYVLSAVLLVAAVLTFAFYHTTNFAMAKLVMFLTGIAGAFCFVTAMRLIRQWFTEDKLALLTGLVVTIGMLGGLVAQYPMVRIINYVGNWQIAYKIIMIIEFILAIACFMVVRNNKLAQETEISLITNILQAIRQSQTWLAGLYTSLMNFPVTLLSAIWGQLYLVQSHAFSQESAAIVTSYLFLGVMIGSPIAGYLAGKFNIGKLLMLLGSLFGIGIILVIMLNQISVFSMGLLFLLLGFISSVQILGYSVVAENSPHYIASASMGVASTIVMSGGTLFQPIFGWILNFSWSGTTINNVAIYSPQSFFNAMLILPIAFVFGMVITKFLKKK